ncbi:hypothetical protein [Deinococcus multiflagellatus]|uniref:Uncharacterized protein n=1 Tax=Deinococcus multiflagellatus TaxID=1656887 RepID=A0ABW1ZQH3_9DEIO|nr:hypothetical protein [Deinococcus multiflagellatus]MBZ9715462.1 hypothetical protein [Deinococcus multiflagellatus]
MPWITRPSRGQRRTLTLALLGGALVSVPTGWWLADSLRWRAPLYCIEQPGQLWGGLAPLPAGLSPTCPDSASYRQEVRAGESRVEQYLVPGWEPLAAARVLRARGYVLLDDELMAPDHYSVFLGKALPAELHYTAVKQGDQTLITISGGPR